MLWCLYIVLFYNFYVTIWCKDNKLIIYLSMLWCYFQRWFFILKKISSGGKAGEEFSFIIHGTCKSKAICLTLVSDFNAVVDLTRGVEEWCGVPAKYGPIIDLDIVVQRVKFALLSIVISVVSAARAQVIFWPKVLLVTCDAERIVNYGKPCRDLL